MRVFVHKRYKHYILLRNQSPFRNKPIMIHSISSNLKFSFISLVAKYWCFLANFSPVEEMRQKLVAYDSSLQLMVPVISYVPYLLSSLTCRSLKFLSFLKLRYCNWNTRIKDRKTSKLALMEVWNPYLINWGRIYIKTNSKRFSWCLPPYQSRLKPL